MMNMKSNTLFNLIALSAALAVSGVGCRHTPQRTSTIPAGERPNYPGTMPPDNAPAMGNPPGNGVTTQTGGGVVTGDHNGWIADTSSLADQTIHFDYDKSAIKSREEAKVDAVADYLKNHANVAVRVEGNCDERGTEEYNRSLGERRALAARERIVSAGVDASRVDIITYGKDKPVDQGHDEAAFSKNRRDEFVVLTPPGQ
jgi:peptidoglycan-associated lipoprotein